MKIQLLGIDPGLRYCGLGLFEDGELRRGWLAINPEMWQRGPTCWSTMADAVEAELRAMDVFNTVHAVAVEIPQVYQTKYQKGDQDDIVQLAATVGAIVSRIPAKHKIGFFPRQWKGQVPKGIHNNRILSRLSQEEFERIECPRVALRHNVIDAVGLGVYTLQFQGKKREWPREKTVAPGTPVEATKPK